VTSAEQSGPDAVPLIELQEVTRTYGSGELAIDALRRVSLRIHAGEFVAIMGASGSGKSTLMNVLGCLDRPTSGRYRFGGEDVTSLDPDRRALLRRDAFGFVFQQYHLLPSASAAENVEVPAVYAGVPHGERLARARRLLAQLGLGDRLEHRPSELSGGQQQRVSIARALINGGQVILADEPTGALDSGSGREMMALLRELNEQGHTVVVITHDPEVARHASRRIQIADGVIVADEQLQRTSVARRPAAQQAQAGAGPGVAFDLVEAVRMAFRSLRVNLFRTVLTLLGIVIGVGSVVTMLALGDGAERDVLSRIEALGTNLLVVRPDRSRRGGAGLQPEDADEIARLPHVASAVPQINRDGTLRLGAINHETTIVATTGDYPKARDWPVAAGVFVGKEDVERYATVIVLGRSAADTLFPAGDDPIGRYVLVNNVPFQVIGVMGAKGASPWGDDLDDAAFVPLTTGGLRLFGARTLRSITVEVDASEHIGSVEAMLDSLLLARRRGERDFYIRNMASYLATEAETQRTFTLLLGSIAAISLLVGGIGVMNIMLVSVTERTREIGIRMATGARAANVRLQFLTEAVVVCTVGGVVGVAGGLGAALVAHQLDTPAMLSLPPVLLAFGCAFATGVVFGFMPAHKAARLDPVAALAAD
jgi:macrolide transport system ATP-binding/permease protein